MLSEVVIYRDFRDVIVFYEFGFCIVVGECSVDRIRENEEKNYFRFRRSRF